LPALAAITTPTKESLPCAANAPPSGTTISLDMGMPALSAAIVRKIASSPPALMIWMS